MRTVGHSALRSRTRVLSLSSLRPKHTSWTRHRPLTLRETRLVARGKRQFAAEGQELSTRRVSSTAVGKRGRGRAQDVDLEERVPTERTL